MSYSYKSFFQQLMKSSPTQHACKAQDKESFFAWQKESRSL